MAGNLTAMIAAAFSGSAAPPVTSDPYFDYTTLLLPGNGTNGAQNNTFLDGSTNNFTITRNGNTTQGTFSPFSQTGWGNYFNGSSNWFTIAENAALQLNGVAFTIELFIYPLTVSTGKMYIGKRDTSGGSGYAFSWYIQGNASGGFTFYTSSGSISSSNSVLNVNSWNHIAVTSDGTNVSLFANGNRVNTPSALTVGNTASSIYIGNFPVDNLYYQGYMSNVRITKNGQLYSGATYIVPTSTLTTTVSSGTVSLLTCLSNRFKDESANNFTLTPSGPPTVVAFSPFNPTASWSAATYGGSGYFDGTGDYLNLGGQSAFAFGTGDFTLEGWFYFNALGNSIYDARPSGTFGGNYLAVGVLSNGQVEVLINTVQISAGAVTINQWTHIAITRSGTDLRLFVNGTQAGSTVTNITNLINGASRPTIGVNGANTGVAYVNGYIGSYRVVTGTAVYTANFTPPTAPLTATQSANTNGNPSAAITGSATSLLLNYTNAGIYDATSKNDLETVGNAQISTAQYKFPPSSMAFDGTTDYLNISPERFSSFGTGSFTVEFWMKTSGSTFNIINPATATGTGYWALLVQTGAGGFRWNDAYNVSNLWTQTATSVLDNNWHHIAIVRNGTGSGNVNIYFDGVAQGTAKTDSTNYNGALTAWRVGSGNAGDFNGYLQDLRITPGIARYTSNFTAPTAAFPTL